jgi:hypothetical protein
MKTCSSCNVAKLFTDFNKSNFDKSGYASKCRACAKEYSKEWHKKNYKKKFSDKVDDNGNLLCTLCKKYFSKEDFHKGKTSWCKGCQKEYDLKRIDNFRVYPRKLNKLGQIHCRNCGEYFDEDKMYISKRGSYKTSTYCLTCAPLLSRIRNIEKYGITIDQYHKMLEDQDYKCKICNKKDSSNRLRLCIDHDHSCCKGSTSCGKCVRGLICFRCNTALGNVKDNIKVLQSMIDYLTK